MADKKATRESYGAALAELGEKYDFLVLDADLAAATKTGMFKKKVPERFFDCGIAASWALRPQLWSTGWLHTWEAIPCL